MFAKSKESQVLYIRHGETNYNQHLEASKDKKQVQVDENFIDCSLNEVGESQAQFLGENIRELEIRHVFCSPLSRCLETALISLRTHPQKDKLKVWVHPFLTEVVNGSQDISKNIEEKKLIFNDKSEVCFDWSYFEGYTQKSFLADLIDNIEQTDQEVKKIVNDLNKEINEDGHYKKLLSAFIYKDIRPESLSHLFERSEKFKKFLINFQESVNINEGEKILVVTHSAFIRMSTTQIAPTIKKLDFYPEDCYKAKNCEVISVFLR
jgi:broad specificity phosphatase PhoE